MNTRNTLMWSVALVALASMVQSALAQKKGGGGAGASHAQAGMQAAQAKNYDLAIAEFTKQIEAAPKDTKGYTNRGTAYRNAGKLNEAIADFTKAIEVDPKDDLAYIGRGQTLQLQQNFPAAIADFNKVLEIKPNDPTALKLRGFANLESHVDDAAINDLSAAIQA
ncbi:MAG: tetratricopeptide repeat protein, partial [Chthoniobacterales bacterium]